jgi:hypothetical protein
MINKNRRGNRSRRRNRSRRAEIGVVGGERGVGEIE